MGTERLHVLAAFAVVTLILAASTAAIRITPASSAQTVTALRVQATPKPPEPTPVPIARNTGRGPVPPDCAGLDNPGGNLKWVPSANSGPWPTNGRVNLPTLGTDAPIVKVGINTAGVMTIPRTAKPVAWLDQGPFPANNNNAVLAGHISYSRVPGAFIRLGALKAGDPVLVTMDGKRWEFRVRFVCAVDFNTPLVEKLLGQTNVPSVTLVTCGGTFSRSAGTHLKRIVARAELVQTA
jgi:LPXTG-site transpeptidase (sortase) family protein